MRTASTIITLLCLTMAWMAAPYPARCAGDIQKGDPPGLLDKLTKYDQSPYYTMYTDLDKDAAREAINRMTRMAEEYHERTKSFAGVISRKFPFYLYGTMDEYHKAGAPSATAGLFVPAGPYLMAGCVLNKDGQVGLPTWHIVQHEGFHQFVHAVIRGDIPIWVNEGLAEFFGESLYTGDGFVTGVIPPDRLKRLKDELEQDKFKSVDKIMGVTSKEWMADMNILNYDQAWSMVHFLALGEKGKYQSAFTRYMQEVGKGAKSEMAWTDCFGSSAGFEEKWKAFWKAQSDNPTEDLYCKARLATLTSFLGRAYAQKQTFDNIDALLKTDAKDMKMADEDWLPGSLFIDAVAGAARLRKDGYILSIAPTANKLPTITCAMPDGTKLTGKFALRGFSHIGVVSVEVVPPPATAPTTKPK